MMSDEVKKIIDKFLITNIFPKILDKDNLLGVIVYGSMATGYYDNNSDIDLLVLLNHAEKSIRGVKYFEGVKFEYFIKPIERFLSEGVSFTNSNCPSHIALNQNAEILYGKKDFVKNILNADNEFYNKNHRCPDMKFDKKLVQIDNRLSSLLNIYKRNGIEFNMVYYNLLELIRDLHSSHSGEAAVPFVKAYRLYTDQEYYDNYVGKNADNAMPDNEFVKLYRNCIEHVESREIMLKNITDLYTYEKSHYGINPKDYELEV